METKLLKIMPEGVKYPEEQALLAMAGETLLAGGTVAFPTETVYGLGGNALDPSAADKIYLAKGRPSDNPLIVHIADREGLDRLIKKLPKKAEKLMDAFWPGPLTMIFEKSDAVPMKVTGGLSTVAVRFPSNEVAKALIKAGGGYVAAPSANRSGGPSPTTAEHVFQDLDGRVDIIIDGGSSVLGLESTIVDMTVDPPMILRPGFITKEMLEEVVGEIAVDAKLLSESSKQPPKAPGMKYRHYAPRAELTLFEGEPTQVAKEIWRRAKQKLHSGVSLGIIATDEMLSYYRDWAIEDFAGKDGENAEDLLNAEQSGLTDLEIAETISPGLVLRSIGSRLQPETIAQNLYKILREFNETEVEEIYSEAFSRDGLGQAIMNRMTKAAGQKIVRLRTIQALQNIDTIIILSKTDCSRGPLAAHLLKKETLVHPVLIETRGLVAPFPEPVNPLMEAAAQNHQDSLVPHKAAQLSEEDIKETTLFFALDMPMKMRTIRNYEGIQHIYSFDEFLESGEAEIESPYGKDLASYESCYEQTEKIVARIAKKLNRLLL